MKCTLLTEGFFSALEVCKGSQCEERAHCAKNVTILTFGVSQECSNLQCLSLFFPVFSDATTFWPFQTAPRTHAHAFVPCSLLHQPELHHSVASLHLDWSNVLVRGSANGLGQLHRSDADKHVLLLKHLHHPFIPLCFSSVLRSRLWHLWGGLVQSQLLYHSQVLHHLHPHLLLFHPCDDNALLLRLHHKNGEKHQCHVSRRLSNCTPEESGERRHQGGLPVCGCKSDILGRNDWDIF